MPLFRVLAKRGFNNAAFSAKVLAINVSMLELYFSNGDVVSPETLRAKGLAKGNYDYIKILGDGTLSRKLTVQAQRISRSAREKIEAAGGTVELL